MHVVLKPSGAWVLEGTLCNFQEVRIGNKQKLSDLFDVFIEVH